MDENFGVWRFYGAAGGDSVFPRQGAAVSSRTNQILAIGVFICLKFVK